MKKCMTKCIMRKNETFPIHLFCSLMLLNFIPFIDTIVRTSLIVSSSVADGLGIAGHIEWFDLIKETLQAFLIIPLYALLNQCRSDEKKFRERIFQSFLAVNTIYILFSVLVLVYCKKIVLAMTFERIPEVTKYLELETIGFIIANVVSFINVVFVILGKSLYIYGLVILKTIFIIFGDLVLIPRFGVNGIAYSNIFVNAVCILPCLAAVFKERLVVVSFKFDKEFVKKYLFIGSFSGIQILLDNIIYSVVVCKMVNEVAEQGNYWTANNIIWGLLLIPILALAEIIKKDCKDKLTLTKMKYYNKVIIVTFIAWLCFIPVLNPFLKNIMRIEDCEAIKHILIILIPFYLVYSYTVLFDNILIGYGKTQYCFAVSMFVNLIYYPAMYGLVLKGIFVPNITFICVMFGFGMVVHLGCSIVCFLLYKRFIKEI